MTREADVALRDTRAAAPEGPAESRRPPAEAPRAPPARLRRHWFTGLDGLRGLAVAAVVAFHFWPSALPAGFFGVDLFFVISGYLITRLLLDEVDQTGRVDIIGFYRRRARRLLPAAYLVITVVAVGSLVFWPDQRDVLRGGVLASLGYVTNWWLIFDHQSYFVVMGRPPLLEHLWSLAIEEQFYLFWPVVLVLVTGAAVLWRRRAVLGRARVLMPHQLGGLTMVAAGLAAASTLLMLLLAVRADVPYGADSGRVYFGTDTHSMGLLAGAAAGALATRASMRRHSRWFRGAFASDVLAVVALALLWQIARSTDEFSPWIYRGGFLLVSLLCVVPVAAVVRQHSALGWVLDRNPLRWLGRRSYAIYLWHWPVAMITRPGLDVAAPGWVIGALRVGLTLLLAELSYRFVEQPLRRRAPQTRPRRTHRRVAPALIATAVATAVCIAVFGPTGPPQGSQSALAEAQQSSEQRSAAQQSDQEQSAQQQSAQEQSAPHPSYEPSPHRPLMPFAQTSPHSSPTPHTSAPSTAAAQHPTSPTSVPATSAFGDSVMLGASSALQARLPGISIDAVEGQQAQAVLASVADQRAANLLGAVVIIQTGDNGIISPTDLANTLRSLADRRRVVLINDRVPRDWQDPNNATLRSMSGDFHNVSLVDWYSASSGHQDWFYRDGLHVGPAGAAAYAALVAQAVGGG